MSHGPVAPVLPAAPVPPEPVAPAAPVPPPVPVVPPVALLPPVPPLPPVAPPVPFEPPDVPPLPPVAVDPPELVMNEPPSPPAPPEPVVPPLPPLPYEAPPLPPDSDWPPLPVLPPVAADPVDLVGSHPALARTARSPTLRSPATRVSIGRTLRFPTKLARCISGSLLRPRQSDSPGGSGSGRRYSPLTVAHRPYLQRHSRLPTVGHRPHVYWKVGPPRAAIGSTARRRSASPSCGRRQPPKMVRSSNICQRVAA